ncbi:MAG: ComEC/Rec2 family competence protein [Clostridia bacterium]|nr:ComEC/Rec2 family competence protein [Clostridia bacterium]
MKGRWFNFRPLFLIFLFLMMGTLFAYYSTQYTIVASITAALTFGIVITVAILKRKIKYFIIPLATFIIAISGYSLAVYSFNKKVEFVPTTIQARVYSVSKAENQRVVLRADNCTFDDKTIDGNITVYLYDNDGLFENIHIGSVIKFKPERFNKTDLFYHDTPDANAYANNLRYTAVVNMQNVTYLKTDNTFAEKIKSQIKQNLNGELTNENVEIAYSALFGDKELLSTEQYSAYKLSGVAHLLAVSGLHVGIIVAILCWVLKRVNPWVKIAIVSLFLIFYTYLCGFATSIIRASIMSIVLLLSSTLRKEYDSLSAISLAGMILFVVNSLVIFDIGFLMSFSCVLGITLLYKPISIALQKIHMPKLIADSFAISCATMVSLMFIMAYYFKTLNIISLIANILLIPIFTFGFTIVFVVSIVSLFLPFVTKILPPVDYIFDFINLCATVLGNLKFANLSTTSMHFIVIPIYFALILIMSRICTARHRNKIIISLPTLAILIGFLL